MKRYLYILIIITVSANSLRGQGDVPANSIITNIIEEYAEATDAESFDFNTIFDILSYYYENPLNINTATENELKELFIINELQINDFLRHREQFGKFLSIYELQALPTWDLYTIQNIVPFLKCDIDAADFNLNFRDALTKGNAQLFIKAKRVIEKRKGFVKNAEGISPYAGDPNHLYLRYRYEYGQSFKAGFTAEKDPGEKLFGDGSRYGFDFYSFFVYAKDINKRISTVSVGDFAVSMGQGLILYNDFAAGKSSYVMNVKKGGRPLRPYSSVNEVNFFRGGGAVVNLSKSLQVTAFASYKPADAIVDRDTVINSDFDNFGNIRVDGYHRTSSEIANKNAIHQTNFGGKMQYKVRNFNMSLNGLYTEFDIALHKDDVLYKKFLFEGKNLFNSSLDYSWRLKNMTLFGEAAMSDNGGIAQLHGILLGLDPKMDVSAVYRNFAPDYHVINGNAFGESGSPVNEKGIYLGMELRPGRKLILSGYADFWQFPWATFRRDGPSEGREFLLKCSYTIRRKLEVYAQYKYEQKLLNLRTENPVNIPVAQALQRLRMHFGYKINKEWEIKNRVEFSWYEHNDESRGTLIYQDLIFKPISGPFSFTARYAMFDINSFDARIYAYENDLLYEYYIPFYQNRGTRFYFNARYRLGRNYTFEMRFGRTYYDNIDVISSGNNQINGNTMTEIKTQVKIRF